jgi:predicted nucleic acid-binding protein
VSPGAVVLDSWPLMAFFEDQDAAADVERLIGEAGREGRELLLSAVNAGEIWYCTARLAGPEVADAVIGEIAAFGIAIVPADWDLARTAAGFKARFPIAYADCFAAALAARNGAPLATGDPELRALDGEIGILWLGDEER